jgi:hypothetical protein
LPLLQPARVAVVDVLDARLRLPEACALQEPLEPLALAVRGLAVDYEPEPLLEREVMRGRLRELLLEGLGHPRQP